MTTEEATKFRRDHAMLLDDLNNKQAKKAKAILKPLHKNFILLWEFEYSGTDEYLKQWVRDDETYTGSYHEDWNFLMPNR